MYLSTIEIHNFGIYKGTHTLPLSMVGSGKNVILIGGENGRGKTTLLDALFLCLYGRKAVPYISERRIAYKEYLAAHINKNAHIPEAHIMLNLQAGDKDDTRLSLLLSWKIENDKISDSFQVTKNGIVDSYLSENWLYYVEGLIPFGIAKFFFFDGEKISQIADDKSFEMVKEPIKTVLGVSTIDTLIGHLKKISKDKNALLNSVRRDSDHKNYQALQENLRDLTSQIESLHAKYAAIMPKLKKAENAYIQTRDEFWKQGGALGLEQDKIRKQQFSLKETRDEVLTHALNLASSAYVPLYLCKNLLWDTYRQGKLAEKARAEKEAAPILSQFYQELLGKAATYLDGNQYDLLEKIAAAQLESYVNMPVKTSLQTVGADTLSIMEALLTQEYSQTISAARTICKQASDIEKEISQLDVHLSNVINQAKSLSLFEKTNALSTAVSRLSYEAARCKQELDSLQLQHKMVEEQQRKLLIQMAETETLNDRKARTIQYAEISISVLQEFAQRLQAQKAKLLESNILLCLKKLLQKDAMVSRVAIDPQSLDITLFDAFDQPVSKDQFSAGEKQMFAMAILWGLALTSGYQLPVVIDTPLARLDSAHRFNFIHHYLPNASKQVIVLSTNEEVYGQYWEELSPYVSAAYTLNYKGSEQGTAIHPGYFGGEMA